MSKRRVRYNPGIHGDEKLITEFVVRKDYLDLVLENLNEASRVPSRHLIVVGPRGTGKTALVRRIAAEVRRQAALRDRWYPIVFAEEAYEVGTPGEFWLTALFHLSDQTQDSNIIRAYEDIRTEVEESRLRERALSALMDFADKEDKRLLLVVENLNMILGQQLSARDGWVLRHTLQNESRLMLLGTAPLRFQDIEHVNKAWFELVTVYELRPLDEVEIKVLWRSLTSKGLSDERLRPIQILTGGNPRLISILASFAVQTSFRQLMDNLIQLIDDHTEYFKGQLDGLAALERKVFVTLLDLWDPSTASEVAAVARISVNKASSLLGRLANRGAVSVELSGRKKRYKATERLYNIYYLMRRRGHPSDRVHAVVTFMIQFYEGDQLITTAKKLVEEACRLDPERRQDHFYAYEDIFKQLPEPDRLKMLIATPREFLNAPDAPLLMKESMPLKISRLTKHSIELISARSFDEAERYLRSALELKSDDSESWNILAQCLHAQNKYAHAVEAQNEVIKLRPNSDSAWADLGHMLGDHLKQPKEAYEAYETAIRLGSNVGWVWASYGQSLKDYEKQYEKSERALRKALELDAKRAWTLAELGQLLSSYLGRVEEGEQILQESVELDPNDAWAWGHLCRAKLLLKKPDDAELTLRRAVELNPDSEDLLGELGHLLDGTGRYEEALKVFEKIVRFNPNADGAWGHLGDINKTLGRFEEAEVHLKRAIEANSGKAWTWTALADLYDGLDRKHEAERAYRRALEVTPVFRPSLLRLLEFLFGSVGKYDDALLVARRFVEENKPNYQDLNSVAWVFCKEAPLEYLPEAEEWARDSVKYAAPEEKWRSAHTLATILGVQGKWKEALEQAPVFLDASASDVSAVGDATDFIISAASAGHAKRSLEIVLASKGAVALEPLAQGLKLFLGDMEPKAQEIVEIGRDVAQRIRDRMKN